MTLDEIDKTLAEWKVRLGRIDDNLVALQLNPAYMRLEKTGGQDLEGVSKERVVPVLATVKELFTWRGLLNQTYERATGLRSRVSRLWRAEELREIDVILTGTSITLPLADTPLARRGLLSGGEESITPERLLAAMATAYEQARDAVTAVEKAWQRLDGECDRAAAEADRLQVLAHELGVDGLPDLADVRVRLQAIKTSADNDPLGATEALTGGVFEQLRALDDRLAALRERRRAVQTGLGQARDLVTKLREAHDRALSAQDRCRGQIALDPDHGLPAPSDPRLIQGFGQWLATLEATTQAGHWSSAGVGLDRWISSAQQALATESEAERAALALLDRRDELLGRLLARRQQALALAARGKVLKIATEEIGERAESLLRQVPTPLAEAAALVAVYEAGLRQP